MTTNVDITFKDLNLPEPLLQALEKVGYEKPSPIQAESIPLILEGHDLLGQEVFTGCSHRVLSLS
jgi:ATP-dependent RNA helicase DeaD